jgi:sec-independent protein translocase protein TatC
MMDDSASGYIEHLEELRKRIIIIVAGWILLAGISYIFSEEVLTYLIGPLKKYQEMPVFTRPVEPFMAVLKICFISGAIINLPNFLYQIWCFIKPALDNKERKVLKYMLAAFFGFFLSGMAFTYFLIIPLGLKVLFSFGKGVIKPLISIGYYLNFILVFMLILGILFNFPVFISGLSAMGLINSSLLRSKRKYAFLFAFVLGAIFTPADIFTQFLVAIPLLILYEISIIFSRIFKT